MLNLRRFTKLTSYQCFVILKITSLQRKNLNLIYRITWSGCFQKCNGKTVRNLINRLDEHGTNVGQPMYLSNCSAFNDHIMLLTLPHAATDTNIVSKELNLHNVVISNVKTLDKSKKWVQHQFLEACYIKKLAPEINVSLKASKELKLFK